MVYADLFRALEFPGSLVSVQFGAFHRVQGWETTLQTGFKSRGWTCTLMDRLSSSLKSWSEGCGEGDIGLIVGLDELLAQSDCEETLAQMRPQIISANARGSRVLILSRAPLQHYPILQGSSVLVDSRPFLFRPLDENAATEFVTERGITSPDVAKNIVRFASGSRALLDIFSRIELADLSGNKKLEEARSLESAVAKATFRELGPSLCTWIEHWVFENQQSEVDASDVPDLTLQSLRAAGMLSRPTGGGDGLNLIPVVNQALWVAALGEVLEEVVEAPRDWSRLVQELFTFERELRLQFAKAFRAKHGHGWAPKVLADRSESIVAFARRDTSPLVEKLADVRSPLDWLTLDALLKLGAEQASLGEKFLGHSEREWHELENHLVPVRNRLAHMRLTREGDWELVRKVRRTSRMRFRAANASP